MKTNDNKFQYITVIVCMGLILLIYMVLLLKDVVGAEEITQMYPQQYQLYNVPLDMDTQQYLINISRKYNVDPELVLAVIEVESSFRPNIISITNDYGLMGINGCNHEEMRKKLGITDFLDAKQNILCGTHILSSHLKYTGDTEKALMCYNCGRGGARRLWRKGIYSTRYSRKVMKAYEKYLTEEEKIK